MTRDNNIILNYSVFLDLPCYYRPHAYTLLNHIFEVSMELNICLIETVVYE